MVVAVCKPLDTGIVPNPASGRHPWRWNKPQVMEKVTMTKTTQTASAPTKAHFRNRGGRMAIATEFGLACLNAKGYPRLYSGPDRNVYVHRRSFEFVAERRVRDNFHIHHQPNPRGKLCWCPHNLIEIQDVLHVKTEPPRNPWNGKFIDAEELRRMTE